MLGLEYTGEELPQANLRSGFPAGVADLVLNFHSGSDRRMDLGLEPTRLGAFGRRDLHFFFRDHRPFWLNWVA